jgi:hypothetical protein
MKFDKDLGVLVCRCVVEEGKPVLFISHAGGDWQMYCHSSNHDFENEEAIKRELYVVHVQHLLDRDPTLVEVADLAVDMGAEREALGLAWTRFVDSDSE